MKKLIVMAVISAAFGAKAEIVRMEQDGAVCEVDTLGARVTSYRPAGGEEVLWNPSTGRLDDPKWAHGGVPVCWPWFSRNGRGDVHGTARHDEFKIAENRTEKFRRVLKLVKETQDARVEVTVILRDTLKIELRTDNLTDRPMTFSQAFHPYFRVGDRDRCTVTQPGGEAIEMTTAIDKTFDAGQGSCAVFRLVDRSLDRTVYVFAENATGVNVWNPGPEKDCPGFIPGDEWRNFVCVEPMDGLYRAPVTVAPHDYRVLMMGVDVRKGSRVTGYAGRDPRRPQAAVEPTGRPFHVMYVGAHPDDADYDYAAPFAKLLAAGAKVTCVALSDGRMGHAEMEPEALAARRLKEAQAAGRFYGFERYVVLGCPDCHVEDTREMRERVARLVRDVAPDVVFTHRDVDYHIDHRATGHVVRDIAYILGIPHWCPGTPVPEKLPFILYTVDAFTVPRRMRPDLVMDATGALEIAEKGLALHESQLFEWMPPEYGLDPATLKDPARRAEYMKKHVRGIYRYYGKPYRDLLKDLYGDPERPVSIAELSEYSRRPSKPELDFLLSVPGFKWTLTGK